MIDDGDVVGLETASGTKQTIEWREFDGMRSRFLIGYWRTPDAEVRTVASACGVSIDQAMRWLVPHGR